MKVILNGKEQNKKMPISWGQVSFGDFLELDKFGQDIIQVIALLSGISHLTLVKSHIKNMDQVIADLGFLKQQAIPADIASLKTILGYPIPKNLEFEQVQMYVDLKNYLAESKELTPMQQLERYTLYCAVYACKAKHGSYDWEKAEAMKDEFLKAPCTEVLAVGNFTLVRMIGLNLNTNLTSPKAGSRLKRFRLVIKGCMILMARNLRLLISKKRLA